MVEAAGPAWPGRRAPGPGELVETLRPALVIMDTNKVGISGIEATRRISASHPEVKVVLLSTYQADDLPGDAASSGYAAYVTRRSSAPACWSCCGGTGPPSARRPRACERRSASPCRGRPGWPPCRGAPT